MIQLNCHMNISVCSTIVDQFRCDMFCMLSTSIFISAIDMEFELPRSIPLIKLTKTGLMLRSIPLNIYTHIINRELHLV